MLLSVGKGQVRSLRIPGLLCTNRKMPQSSASWPPGADLGALCCPFTSGIQTAVPDPPVCACLPLLEKGAGEKPELCSLHQMKGGSASSCINNGLPKTRGKSTKGDFSGHLENPFILNSLVSGGFRR